MRAPFRRLLSCALICACGPGVPDDTAGSTGDASTSGSTSSSTSTASTTSTSTGEPTTSTATTVGPTTSTSTSTSPPSTSTTDATTLEPGTTTGEFDPALCEAAAFIELKDPLATPGTPPAWNPGETVTLTVTLHNTGAEDFNGYPGIHVESDHPGVTAETPGNWLFAIFAGMESQLDVTFTAAPDVPAPVDVTFTIRIDVLHVACPDFNTIEFVVPLE